MPSQFGFEPRSPRYDPFSVLGLVDTNNAQSGPFLAIFGPFLGHIVELEGNEELFVTGQSNVGTTLVNTKLHKTNQEADPRFIRAPTVERQTSQSLTQPQVAHSNFCFAEGGAGVNGGDSDSDRDSCLRYSVHSPPPLLPHQLMFY